MSFKFSTIIKHISLNLRIIIGLYNLKSLKFSRQFIDYFLRYPNIKQTKKHKSKKVFCTLASRDWAQNWHRSSQAYRHF